MARTSKKFSEKEGKRQREEACDATERRMLSKFSIKDETDAYFQTSFTALFEELLLSLKYDFPEGSRENPVLIE